MKKYIDMLPSVVTYEAGLKNIDEDLVLEWINRGIEDYLYNNEREDFDLEDLHEAMDQLNRAVTRLDSIESDRSMAEDEIETVRDTIKKIIRKSEE